MMSGGFRYAAFVSYSSRDAAFAQRLHRVLEAYEVPKALGSFDLLGDGTGKKNRVYPVFRDREELAAGHLAERIEASLKASASLVVVCSPNAAVSPWVQREIEFFIQQGRADCIFAIIAEDAPLFDATGADATGSCFPPAFRADALRGGKLEPLAADARKGKDGFRKAYLKVVSGLVGLTPGQLIDRDRQRRGRQRLMIGVGAAVVMLGATIPLVWQETARWRSELTRRAEAMRSEGRPDEAMTLALAGMDLGGSLMPARASDAAEVVRALAGLTRLAEVPEGSEITASIDGKVMQLYAPDGTVTVFDLAGNKPPRALGKVERSGTGRSYDDGFRSRSVVEGESWAIPYTLDAEIIRMPVGSARREWKVDPDPDQIRDPVDAARKIVAILPTLDADSLAARLANEEYVISLGQNLTDEQEKAIEALEIAGLTFSSEVVVAFPAVETNNGVGWAAFPGTAGGLHLVRLGPEQEHRQLKLDSIVTGVWFGTAGDGLLAQTQSGQIYAIKSRDGEPKPLGKFDRIVSAGDISSEELTATCANGDRLYIKLGTGAGPAEATLVAKLDMNARQDVAVKLADGDYAIIVDPRADQPLRRLGKFRNAEFERVGENDDKVVVFSKDDRTLHYFDLTTSEARRGFATLGLGLTYSVSSLGTMVVIFNEAAFESGRDQLVTWYRVGNGAPKAHSAILRTTEISEDEKRIAIWRGDGGLSIADVTTGETTLLGTVGQPSDMRFTYAGDALVVLDAKGKVTRFDFKGGETLLGDTGGVEEDQLTLSFDGKWIAASARDGVLIMDPAGKAPSRLLPVGAGATVGGFYEGGTVEVTAPNGEGGFFSAGDGSRVLMGFEGVKARSSEIASLRAQQDDAGRLVVRDQTSENDKEKIIADLGVFEPIGQLAMTSDAKTVVAAMVDGAVWVIDVASPGAKRNLAQEHPHIAFAPAANQNAKVFDLSKDGKALVVRGKDGVNRLFNLRGRWEPTPVGRAADPGGYQFLGDGQRIVLGQSSKRRVVYDLAASAAVMSLEGGDLANAVCRQNGGGLAPFGAELRDPALKGARSAADQLMYDALKGRPWNPCDWRGLFSILPDDSGGGWFEGPLQWLRLVGVRMGWAADYGCAETVSGTDASRADRRREACLAATRTNSK